MHTIYSIKFPNMKYYIGQTKDLSRRKRYYEKGASKYQPKIARALDKYGWSNCEFSVLEVNLNKDEANYLEIYYIKQFDCIADGYNISTGGYHSPTENPEVVAKLVKYNKCPIVKERKRQEMLSRQQNPEFIQKISDSNRSEYKRNISRETTKLRMQDSEFRNKVVKALHSNETQRIEKLRSPETRAKNSTAQKKRYLEGKCKLPNKSKAIMCIETGIFYSSAKAAADDMGLNGRLIRRVASGERTHTKGFSFKFINEEK